jgi:chromate transporter
LIAVAGALIVSVTTVSIGQMAAILLGGIAGLWLCRDSMRPPTAAIAIAISRRAGFVCLAVFVLLALLPLLVRAADLPPGVALFDAFYRSGALVFGGGHVVLPLLRSAFVTAGWVSDDTFLAGYGAAQAVPGPLFTFAAYLGAVVHLSPNGVAGAAIGLIGIFLPGMLLLVATLPHWERLRTRANAQASMRGINATVVGILGAALYDPVWSSTVRTPTDVAAALAGFLLLIIWRVPPLVVVIGGALAGIGLAQFASR